MKLETSFVTGAVEGALLHLKEYSLLEHPKSVAPRHEHDYIASVEFCCRCELLIVVIGVHQAATLANEQNLGRAYDVPIGRVVKVASNCAIIRVNHKSELELVIRRRKEGCSIGLCGDSNDVGQYPPVTGNPLNQRIAKHGRCYPASSSLFALAVAAKAICATTSAAMNEIVDDQATP
jgi:hypothetical protein